MASPPDRRVDERIPAARSLVIFGAGGHGRVAADCAASMLAAGRAGWRELVFLDPEHGHSRQSGRWTIHGPDQAIADFDPDTTDCFAAVGDNGLRKRIQEAAVQRGYRFAVLVHPSAVVGSDVSFGDGTLVMPNAVVNFGATVGNGSIVNTGAIVEHDCGIGAWVHLAPGSVLGGDVKVGDGSFVGLGARVLPGLEVCPGAVIGGGATVTRPIARPGIYVGTPARPI